MTQLPSSSWDRGYLSAGVQAARPVRFGRKLRRAPVEDLTAEERAVEHQALQMSMANIFELFRRDVSALLDGDDEDAGDDDDNQSVASEHMDFDDHIAAENMTRFCIRVSDITETFFSIAT
ncbi:hypothetical protein CNMCM8980_010104 [Aspergillus fumigatiaffinis]|uniref:Uncharacterized protein n=1 Tax=Aspergillus fumigatiaffinis TaxID=340414 RepID=A0A8H4HFG9_9EURO|nr:hypothetical protein CNMCM6805_002052 [Aspergillus fumigatiaffinis]KAF4250782.1 hypothetical protein CNMCM8980_010104 [Aspergillus fumigatiaffinis]